MATPSPFLNLPKELRLLIYEQVYPPTPPPQLIHIITEVSPPNNCLLLTNRQIHHETHALYKTSFRAYWTTGKFMLTHESAIAATSRDKIITSPFLREMQHITNLMLFYTSNVHDESFVAYMVHPNGGWKIVIRDISTTFRRYRRSLWRKDAKSKSVVVPTSAAWDAHGSEEDLVRTCGKVGCGVPVVNQVLDLCGVELIDLTAKEWWRGR